MVCTLWGVFWNCVAVLTLTRVTHMMSLCCEFQRPALFELVHCWNTVANFSVDTVLTKKDKDVARQLIHDQTIALGPKLLRSFHPGAIDYESGNNALHELCTHFYLNPNSWNRLLAELLIAHGVSVRERNKKGRTPFLQFASTCSATSSTAKGLTLMLEHGSDLNAQDGDGNSVLHLLVLRKAFAVLEDLLSRPDVTHLDCILKNHAGQTAADITAIQLALAQQGVDQVLDQSHEFYMHRLVLTFQEAQIAHFRPILKQCIDSVIIPDIGAVVLGYVDGSGNPFSQQPVTEVSDNNNDDAHNSDMSS